MKKIQVEQKRRPEGRLLWYCLGGNGLELSRRYRTVLRPEVTGQRVRVHGDYHLGELLYAGGGFVVIDFEGDADRPLSERRIKRSPLVDQPRP